VGYTLQARKLSRWFHSHYSAQWLLITVNQSGDTIELPVYKIFTGKYDSNCGLQLYLRSESVHASVTRGNYYKLVPQHCRYDLRKYYFTGTNRVVPVWDSLPNDVVMADNINIFKNRIDKFWSSYDFVYLFRAQQLETGSVK